MSSTGTPVVIPLLVIPLLVIPPLVIPPLVVSLLVIPPLAMSLVLVLILLLLLVLLILLVLLVLLILADTAGRPTANGRALQESYRYPGRPTSTCTGYILVPVGHIGLLATVYRPLHDYGTRYRSTTR